MFHVKHLPLRICTYNIHGGKDAQGRPSLDLIAATLRETAPDVCLLQEVDRFLPRSGWEDQAARLAAELDAAFHFYGRWGVGKSRFGNALLSCLPVVSIRRVALGDTAHPLSGGEPRSALGVALSEGTAIWNTHLGLRPEWRTAQLATLTRAVGVAGPVLVGGDFNAGLEEDALRRFLDKTGLQPLGPPEPTFPALAPRHRIDLLLGRGWITQDAGTVAAPGSDHCLVWADLEPETVPPAPSPPPSGA